MNKEELLKRLEDIEAFKVEIDELHSKGYNPILDDGVGKILHLCRKRV